MSIFTYTKDYKEGFRAAYILGPVVALKQIHRWEQEENAVEIIEPYERETEEDRRQRLEHEAGQETQGTADPTAESEDANKMG